MNYEEIKINGVYSFSRIITREDVLAFAKLIGDHNKLHVDEEFGKKSEFKKNIAHGMLAGGLFSTLVGMYIPGEESLYLSQTLNFKQPVFYGDEVEVRGTVINKNDSIKMITLKTEILKEGKVVVGGEAKVKVLNILD